MKQPRWCCMCSHCSSNNEIHMRVQAMKHKLHNSGNSADELRFFTFTSETGIAWCQHESKLHANNLTCLLGLQTPRQVKRKQNERKRFNSNTFSDPLSCLVAGPVLWRALRITTRRPSSTCRGVPVYSLHPQPPPSPEHRNPDCCAH